MSSRDNCLEVPLKVKHNALLSLKWKDRGETGGTKTGLKRAKQLSTKKCIPIYSLREMRTWFSRHGPDAKNGGTCYQGYLQYLQTKEVGKGAVAWMLWGGDEAYEWLKTKKVMDALRREYPKSIQASRQNNLSK